ncbi:MAG: hypothetical protein RLY20_3337 [Verrucomicrobiota bacterium]|jgi:hypothetical protein
MFIMLRKLTLLVSTSLSLLVANPTHAALLAYEPFTNTVGSAVIGSGGGSGFANVWQTNSSGGVATNTAGGLSYTDVASNSLVTLGGAAFFQGLTTANTSMQPTRPFIFSRGTNGADGTTTWISFLICRQGPTNGSATNGWLRGANVPHDLGTAQKLAIGNSSGAATNTVGLIPQGSASNLKSSTTLFGGRTNFVVVRIDHIAGAANDNAWLFVNPPLTIEPSTNAASTNSLGAFDYSFDTLRIFAGGQSSASQPYAEIIVDEYRIGDTFADVAPYSPVVPPAPPAPLIITNASLVGGSVVLAGTGGTSNASYTVLSSANLVNSSNWPAIGSNTFDANGNFVCTNPFVGTPGSTFFRLFVPYQAPPAPVAPSILTSPTNLNVVAGQSAAFNAMASGTAPLTYQWLFNTNSPISGATATNYSIASAQSNHAGTYSLRVANVAGAVTSSVATLTVFLPPSISSQPQTQSITASNAANFSVAALGTAPLRYQWFFNTNTALVNATNANFGLASVQTSDAGAYSVRITNNYGAITSSYAVLTVLTSTPLANYYVATNGSDSNNGTNITTPFATLAKAASVATAGKLVYVRGGTYATPSKVSFSKLGTAASTIRIWAYPGEVPVINATGNSSDGIGISGDFYHLRGLTVTLAGHNGINISGDSNIVENCVVHDNGNTGLHLTGSAAPGPTGNLILNCDSYRNYDPPIGGNADGFSAKWDIGPGNVFNGCRAWENSDDGWDLWMGTNPVLITNCWAFRHGIDYWFSGSFNGNGNGFKMGGNYVGTPHIWVHCVSFGNAANGYDQNNNILGQTVDQCTGWNNAVRNFNLNHGTNTTPHVVRNNLSFGAPSGDSFRSGSLLTNNSWQVISPAPTAADVQSIDDSVAVAPRNADGSLPEWPFLRPVIGGRLVDKGVNIGQPFNGTAPDLGAFETP